MRHRTSLAVRFNELDPYGHVNHSVYLTYLEVGRADALDACGVSLADLAAGGFQLVITKVEARFLAAAVGGDRLSIETEVAEMRRASGVWAQRILRGDEVLLTARVTAAVTGRDGRPTRPPDWLFPALEKLTGDHG
jgi:acyl-CoA thioester hydrolase